MDFVIDNFCKNPSKDTITLLPKKILKIFYELSKYCIKNNKGYTSLAKDIILYCENKRHVCMMDMSMCDIIAKDKKLPYTDTEYFSREKCYSSCKSKPCPVVNRVRQIIPNINYTELSKRKILPKKTFFTKVPTKGGEFPPIARKIKPSYMGIIIDYYIRLVIQLGRVPTRLEYTIPLARVKPVGRVPTRLENTIVKPTEKDYKFFEDTARFIIENINVGEHVEIEPEWTYGSIQGHPDLIIGDTIYDVKMTGLFGRMRIDTIKQLLCYYVLSKFVMKRVKIKNIGVILPAQKMFVKVNISDWKWKPFWKEMVKASSLVLFTSPIDINNYNIYVKPYVGNHIPKVNGTVWKSVEKYRNLLPHLQIFLSGQMSSEIKDSEAQLKKAKDIITKNNVSLFVHAPYFINLCRVEGSSKKIQKGKFDKWTPVATLKKQMDVAKFLKCKGVVVHLGNKVSKDVKEIYDIKLKGEELDEFAKKVCVKNMLVNVANAAKYATKSCPLLLETGSGTEVVSDVNKFADFYNKLDENTRKVTSVCVDTCHVFASGFMPMDALNILLAKKVPINLIHFNDSKCPFGSKKDRHASIGSGLIPFNQLLQVGIWAVKHNIPMVYE